MIKKIKLKICMLKETGFFSIFVSTIFSKIIAFFGNVIIARIFCKNDYGIYSYVINAITMLYIFNDFGSSNAALQFLTEERNNINKQKKIIKYALKVGLSGALFSGILILLSPLFYPFEIIEAKYYTPILCLIPLLTNVNSFISIILRANLENKKYAFLEFSKTFLNYLFLIFMSLKFGIMGAILSQYCYTFIALILGIMLLKNIIGSFEKTNSLQKSEKKVFIKYSISTQLNNTLNSILLNIDLFLVGYILANSSDMALYKVATTIPMALSFLPSCVMIYLLPYFVSHNTDGTWIKSTCKKLIIYGLIGYGFLTTILIVFAPFIISMLYGNQYNDAIITFRILMISFFFNATFKIPINNILFSMRKVKVNLIVTIISVVLNFILNIVFIIIFGRNGAAITTSLISVVSSVILVLYIRKIRTKI